MPNNRGFQIKFRGDGVSPSTMLVLRDDGGIRASRECRNFNEVDEVLLGWIREFSLSADIEELLDRALEEADPAVFCALQQLSTESTERAQFLTPEEVKRLLRLLGDPYRPSEILLCEREITAKTLLAETVLQMSGHVDLTLMEAIVALRLERDRLYGRWATGEIG